MFLFPSNTPRLLLCPLDGTDTLGNSAVVSLRFGLRQRLRLPLWCTLQYRLRDGRVFLGTRKVLDSGIEDCTAIPEEPKAMVTAMAEQPAYLPCLMVMVNMKHAMVYTSVLLQG